MIRGTDKIFAIFVCYFFMEVSYGVIDGVPKWSCGVVCDETGQSCRYQNLN